MYDSKGGRLLLELLIQPAPHNENKIGLFVFQIPVKLEKKNY